MVTFPLVEKKAEGACICDMEQKDQRRRDMNISNFLPAALPELEKHSDISPFLHSPLSIPSKETGGHSSGVTCLALSLFG